MWNLESESQAAKPVDNNQEEHKFKMDGFKSSTCWEGFSIMLVSPTATCKSLQAFSLATFHHNAGHCLAREIYSSMV